VSAHRLLLVDSDPGVHELLNQVLGREDRFIEHAYDGQEALRFLQSTPSDVIVAGQGKNGFDGLKLLRRVQAIRPEARVIVAGEAVPEKIVGAIRNRAYSYFHKPFPATPLADMVQQALETGAWKDDIGVVSARPEWITLDLRCKMEAAERTIQFERELHADLPAKKREDIASAFRELLLNAVEHGGKANPRRRVRVLFLRGDRALMVQIFDPGRGFSLDSLPHAAISNPEDSPTRHVEVREESGQRPGGFGILMARNQVDELLYNQRGNAVMFVKYL
jgi:two-component system, OmpR family, response regulator